MFDYILLQVYSVQYLSMYNGAVYWLCTALSCYTVYSVQYISMSGRAVYWLCTAVSCYTVYSVQYISMSGRAVYLLCTAVSCCLPAAWNLQASARPLEPPPHS